MSTTEAVKQYAEMKLRQIVTEQLGKPIPNWFSIEDMKGFGILVSEGELNFLITATVFPVPDEPNGGHLVKLQASFMSKPVIRQGYEFSPVPIGNSVLFDIPLYAEEEQELQDGILQYIYDEASNIMCQILV